MISFFEAKLYNSLAFTPTKDNSPKRQFKNSFHYGVKLIYLENLNSYRQIENLFHEDVRL